MRLGLVWFSGPPTPYKTRSPGGWDLKEEIVGTIPIEQHPDISKWIDRVDPYLSTIQTNRSGLIHVLTEMQVFRDQIPTQVQFKQEDYIDGGSVIAQRRCPEEM